MRSTYFLLTRLAGSAAAVALQDGPSERVPAIPGLGGFGTPSASVPATPAPSLPPAPQLTTPPAGAEPAR